MPKRPMPPSDHRSQMPPSDHRTLSEDAEWWQEHSKQFPNVPVMARQYLGCSATSATVENAVGHYLNPHRSVGIA
jgi:hypothetical protein